jgi:PhoH-like ATPase
MVTPKVKNYVVDTNVLLDDPGALAKLRNGHENNVFIPYHVLLELGKFKKDPRLGRTVARVIHHLNDAPDDYAVLKPAKLSQGFSNLVDGHILDEIETAGLSEPILVTNDRMFQIQARLRGIHSESYRNAAPFQIPAESITGFVPEGEEPAPNLFRWNESGRPVLCTSSGERVIDFTHRIWNVQPRSIYQNLAFELMIHPDIHVVSIHSAAGYGKSFLALASALYLMLERKHYNKVYLVKPMVEIGQKLGYLPGRVEEKMEPYTRYILDLLVKLHRLRSAARIFSTAEIYPPQLDRKRFEILPLTYIRGMNIENAVVIIDEMQNMTRAECRALLSRLGEGVKCLCLGDIHQVDHPYLTTENNGMNWVVSSFSGSRIYAHLVLKGEKSRGPITDLVIKSGL